jgi:hypothetical protein
MNHSPDCAIALEAGNPALCPSCKTRFEISPARGIVKRLYFTFEDEDEVAKKTRSIPASGETLVVWKVLVSGHNL